jgi:hypothetical protein
MSLELHFCSLGSSFRGSDFFERIYVRFVLLDRFRMRLFLQSVLPGAVDTEIVEGEHSRSFWSVKAEEFVPLAIAQVSFCSINFLIRMVSN